MDNWKDLGLCEAYWLVNTDELSERYPDMFHRPHNRELRALMTGDQVKLLFYGRTDDGEIQSERMWVKITDIHLSIDLHPQIMHPLFAYTGTLVNEPAFIEGVDAYDVIQFNQWNITNVKYADGWQLRQISHP